MKWTSLKYIYTDGHIETFSRYEVSDTGLIRTLRFGKSKSSNVKLMKQQKDNRGYMTIRLKGDNGACHTFYTHRIVMSSFKEHEWFPSAVVDHVRYVDNECCLNSLSNLRWFTSQQNNSTERHRTLSSRAHTNHSAYSKKIKVTDLATGETTEYPSTHEAERQLGLPVCTCSATIRQSGGVYKKRNLIFRYVQ